MSRQALVPAALLLAIVATSVVVAMEHNQGVGAGGLIVYGVIVFLFVYFAVAYYTRWRR